MEDDDFLKSLHELLCGQKEGNLMEMANKSPLYMMIQLLASDPQNKTYQACFHKETDNLIEGLSSKMSMIEAMFLSKILDKIDEGLLKAVKVENVPPQSVVETKIMVDTLHYVLGNVIDRKKNKKNDE